ncbi:MobF family relaxase [Sphingomonas sp. H160509]|uniref:MobF family relaxase n=1 Tax=Sphingomonas sp. H160509 TaxID=2955313 RepID=UPI0020972AA3|nr:MobF family relaxase [Sphingomonas sp. H160509]MDD1453240.1 MobF family relaxase [Sphingomonas sp. H160509]
MLTPAVVRSTSGAASYYAADNYYTDGQATEASLWAGQGAEALGLDGPVSRDPFEAVLAGSLPNGDSISTGPNGKHRAGLDFTFSAPKSLSLLAYVGGDARLLTAHMAAVKTTIGWIEANLAEARVTRDGRQEPVKSGNLVVALFQHDTSRALDPQAHIHAIIANVTKAPDGSWHALHNDKLWEGYTAAASVYNATLRGAVEQLGYTTERVAKHGQFEIAGVPRDVIELFSTRSAEIDAGMAAMKHRTPEARSAVTLSTRAAKPAEIDRDVLRAEWGEKARGAGGRSTRDGGSRAGESGPSAEGMAAAGGRDQRHCRARRSARGEARAPDRSQAGSPGARTRWTAASRRFRRRARGRIRRPPPRRARGGVSGARRAQDRARHGRARQCGGGRAAHCHARRARAADRRRRWRDDDHHPGARDRAAHRRERISWPRRRARHRRPR